jgi:transposase InsO family protein
VRYQFIGAEKAEFPVRLMCRILKVTRGGFYAWLHRGTSARAQANERLRLRIRDIHQRSRGTYGSPRICAELEAEGFKAGRNRVAREMRQMGLLGRRPKRFRKTTDSDHTQPVAANLLDRNFDVERPNQVWATDITYIWTREGWLYLAVVIDLFARRVVGWAMAAHMRTELVLEALGMALGRRLPPAGLMHHSDRGSQYASGDYRKLLDRHGIVCSMSGKGACWDNAVAESFFGTLKVELVYRSPWDDRATARLEISEFIECFYNSQRRHSSLGYRTPAEHERIFTQGIDAAA